MKFIFQMLLAQTEQDDPVYDTHPLAKYLLPSNQQIHTFLMALQMELCAGVCLPVCCQQISFLIVNRGVICF